MKFEVTIDTIQEIAMCIVDCGMNRDEAAEYAKNALLEANGIGSGESSQVQATLIPVSSSWEQMEKSYESIFGLSRDGDAF